MNSMKSGHVPMTRRDLIALSFLVVAVGWCAPSMGQANAGPVEGSRIRFTVVTRPPGEYQDGSRLAEQTHFLGIPTFRLLR